MTSRAAPTESVGAALVPGFTDVLLFTALT